MPDTTPANTTLQGKSLLPESWSGKMTILLKTMTWLFRAVIYHTVEATLRVFGYTDDGPERERARDFILIVLLFTSAIIFIKAFFQCLWKFFSRNRCRIPVTSHVCESLQNPTHVVCTSCGEQSDFKTKLIIDTDCGIDGAMALMLALDIADCQLVGITCTHGVSTVQNAWRNVFGVLALYEDRKVPVFAGCNESILGYNKFNSIYHGEDGLGGVSSYLPDEIQKKLEPENAVFALIRLSIEYSGNLNILCLGPLSNIALAHRVDPNFSSRIRNLIVHGGNYYEHPIIEEFIPPGPRNLFDSKELNFECDIEASNIIIGEFLCPIICVPLETCYSCNFPWKLVDDITNFCTNRAIFVQYITKELRDLGVSGLCPNAFLAVAALLDPHLGHRCRRKLNRLTVTSTGTEPETAAQRRHKIHGPPEIEIITKIDKEKALYLLQSIVK